MMPWWRWENKARSSFEWLKKATNVRERMGRRSGLLRTVRETNLCGLKGGDEECAGCGGHGEGSQIRKARQRSSTSNKGQGLSRSGQERARVSFFPSWTTSHLLRDAEVEPSQCSLAPGAAPQGAWSNWSPRPQGWTPRMASAAWPISRLITLFSNSPRYVFPFSSAQLSSSRVAVPPPLYPGQCKPSPSAGRKLGFRWPSLCCWFPAEHGPLGLLVLRTAHVRPPPSLPRLDQPTTHSVASPSNSSVSSVLTKRTQSFVCASLF